MNRFRVPADPHSVVIVSLASIATVVYTMWPWIQEQKQKKLEYEHNQFQLLKATDPIAAQQYIDSLRQQEWWVFRQIRQLREKRDLEVQMADDYFDQRSQAAVTANAIILPPGLFDKPAQTLHFPTSDEITASLLRGKSLDTPAETTAAIKTNIHSLDNTPTPPVQPQLTQQSDQQPQRPKTVRGQAVLMSDTDETNGGRITLTTHFNFDALTEDDPIKNASV